MDDEQRRVLIEAGHDPDDPAVCSGRSGECGTSWHASGQPAPIDPSDAAAGRHIARQLHDELLSARR